jgi:uncharacterized protein YjbJ (UPF0337 family)
LIAERPLYRRIQAASRGSIAPRHQGGGNAACSILALETAMNWDQIALDWTQFKSKVSQNWVKLTDEDLTRISGRRKELASRLQARYGFGRDEAEREIEAWVETQRHAA